MTVTVLVSVGGAPGVTTTAMLLAGCMTGAVVGEADLDGSTLAIRYGLGREPGLTTLAAAGSSAPDAWRDHAQLAGGMPVLVGPDAPDLAAALWARAGGHLAAAFAAADADVVIDAGRFRGDASLGPVFKAASIVAVVIRPEAEDLVRLLHRLPEIRRHGADVGVVLAGQGAYRPDDVSDQLGVDLLGVVPRDPRTAAAMAGRGGLPVSLARSELARAARTLADAILSRVDASAGEPAMEVAK